MNQRFIEKKDIGRQTHGVYIILVTGVMVVLDKFHNFDSFQKGLICKSWSNILR